MTTRTQILHLLRGRETARIRFTFPFAGGTVTIGPGSFHYVAAAIELGKVRVDPTNVFPSPDVAGQYISGTPNVLRVKPILGREEEGMILHECTHAVFDLTRTQVTANQDEAAAYVVDALYYRMTGLRRPRWNAEPHATAGAVADALLSNYAAGTRGIPVVDANAWNLLCGRVMLDPYYFGRPAGLLGAMFGQQYPHDG
jgi:hypothetical protein